MTPFEEFRLWLREGARFERALTAIGVVLVVALIGVALVPTGSSQAGGQGAAALPSNQVASVGTPGSIGSTAPSQAPALGGTPNAVGPVGSPSPAPSGSGPTGGAPPLTGPAQGPAGTRPVCANRTSTDQGVTATTIKVGVILLDVAGGNAILGVPSPSEQRRENDAEISAINAAGGLDCRKIVATFYTDNPLDANSEHAVCLQVVSDKVFAVIGGLYQAQNATCLPQNRIPTFTQTQRPTSQLRQFYPYYFSFYDDSATDFGTYVVGAKQQGFFNGLTKLGVVTGDCYPEYNTQLIEALSAGGIPSNKIETFDYGCPAGGIPSPPTVAQAVFTFQRDGVNRVMSAGANLGSFSNDAQSQQYHPRYAVSDIDTTMTLSPSTGFQPNASNFDGALDVSNSQYGATNTPGVSLSPATGPCDAILVKGGAQRAEAGDGYSGGTCNQWSMFLLGATHGARLARTELAAGLDSVGLVEQSYPGAPALWNQPGKTWAGPYWRPIRFDGSCACWKVVNAAFSSVTG